MAETSIDDKDGELLAAQDALKCVQQNDTIDRFGAVEREERIKHEDTVSGLQ